MSMGSPHISEEKQQRRSGQWGVKRQGGTGKREEGETLKKKFYLK